MGSNHKSIEGIKDDTAKLPYTGEIFFDTETIFANIFRSNGGMKRVVREHNRKQIKSLQEAKKLFKS